MGFLLLSLIALVAGPLLGRLARRARPAWRALDGFVFTTLVGLVVLELIPHAAEAAGALALLAAAGTLIVLRALEERSHGRAAAPDRAARGLALAGLAVHALVDGVALATTPDDSLAPLALVLHRLPEGLAVWFLWRPTHGPRAAALALAALGVASLIGFVAGDALAGALDGAAAGWFQAVVCGALLHLALHRHDEAPWAGAPPAPAPAPPHHHHHAHGDHHHDHHHDAAHFAHHPHDDTHAHPTHLDEPGLHDRRAPWRWPEGVGALVAGALVAALLDEHGHHALEAVGAVLAALAAPLVAALVAAGLVHALGAREAVPKGGGSALAQAARGVALGLPEPVCACGVVPLYRSLGAHGAAPPLALGFLLGTPALGLDGLIVTAALLGAPIAGAQAATAVLVAVLVAALVGARSRLHAAGVSRRLPQAPPAVAARPLGQRLVAGWRWSFTSLPDHGGTWLVFGLFAVALAAEGLGRPAAGVPPVVAVPLAAAAALPLYVGAAGVAPLALGALAAGLPAGAVLAFAVVAPAIDRRTLAAVAARHGGAAAALLAGGVWLGASAAGLAFEAVAGAGFVAPALPALPATIEAAALVVLGGVALGSILRLGPRGLVEQVVPSAHHH